MQEIAVLFGLHKNAVLRWLKEGLQANTDRRPYLIRGSELIRFLSFRQQSKKQKCSPTEFFCFKCRAPRGAYEGIADLTIESSRRIRIRVLCADCSTSMNKVQALKNLPQIETNFHVQQRDGWHLLEGTDFSVNSDKGKQL